MIKRNKVRLIISSIVILLPMLLGVLASGILPEKIAVHWGIDGKADGFGPPWLVFVILPLILLAIHWLCLLLTAVIDKNVEQNKKIMGMTFWIVPVISLGVCGMVFSIALGYTSNIFAVIMLILALAFIIIGNYIPKTTRNLTMGIKVKWALYNDENWYATHRFAGKLYVAVGFLCLLAMPLPSVAFPFVAIAIILLVAILPTVYSYRFYKKQLSEGSITKESAQKNYGELVKKNKLAFIISVVLIAVLVVVLIPVTFTGKIETTFGDTSLTIAPSFGSDITIAYDHIESVEYREDGVSGERIYGFSSAILLHGTFRNEEFGAYQRYTYTGKKPCIVLNLDNDIVVLGAADEQELREIYDRISEEISE